MPLTTEQRKLAEEHLRIAEECAARYPIPNDPSESRAVAYLGLVKAAGRFDPENGASFSSFAYPTVVGALADAKRKMAGGSRHARVGYRAISKARDEFVAKNGRYPTEAEWALASGMPIEKFRHLRWQIDQFGFATVDSLDAPYAHLDGDCIGLGDTIAADEPPVDEAILGDYDERAVVIQNALKYLSPRERQVVTLYFFQGITLREIGKVLGVTESRVCQIKDKALERLRHIIDLAFLREVA